MHPTFSDLNGHHSTSCQCIRNTNSRTPLIAQKLTYQKMEAAGLALAVFPLLISAIENWESCFRSTRSLLHWKKELQHTARQLSLQHIGFLMNLEALLTPIVDSQEEIAEMLEEPGSELWKGSRGLELSKKLGMASSVYQTTVIDCERILRELSNKCNLLRDDQWVSMLLTID